MRLDRFLAKSRIIEVESTDFAGALHELVTVAIQRSPEVGNPKRIVSQLITREKTMTTYLGHGVAMPHVRLKMKRPFIFALGRVRPEGLDFDEAKEYQRLRLIFLLLAGDSERNYLNVLATLARLFREEQVIQQMVQAPDTNSFREVSLAVLRGMLSRPDRGQHRFNRLLLKEAEKVAREAQCSAILLFSDTFAGGVDLEAGFPNFRTILITRAGADTGPEVPQVESTIEVRSFSHQRLSQTRSAILIGLTRGLLKPSDRVCCVGGVPGSNQIDTIMVVDLEREFHHVLERESNLLPGSVKIEVVERVLGIATELAVEGREGKPVGTLFVLGDTDRVNGMVKPLVLNPFYGYRKEDRNVLNPFMDETLKEFSVMDGGFVIRGDGVVESAGSLVYAPAEFYEDLPSGFGSRHSAAAAISRAADCLAVCVSASTGQVTLFRRGVMLPLLERPLGWGG